MTQQGNDSVSREETQARQSAAWRPSRRHLLKMSAFGGAGIALGGLAATAEPLVQPAAAQDAAPKLGGAIAMSLAEDDVQSFDPIIPTDNMSLWTMLLIYDTLIRIAPDGNSLESGIAASWVKSDDGLTYTFTLREATFHDGTPVSATDVAYCLDRAVNSEESTWAFLFSAVSSIEALDPKTVVITLKSVWASFEANLALCSAAIIPRAAHETQGDALFQAPIGSGPFVFDSWEKGARIVLKKNPNYWDMGKPYLDELNFFVLTDANSRMLQFQGGDLDIATAAPYSQLESIRANPDFVLHEEAVARLDHISINVGREPFTDVKVRQAVNHAVNKDVIIENVLFGAGQMANSYLPLMYGHDDSIPGYPYDLDKAQALIAETAAKDGFAAELLIQTGSPVQSQVAQLVAADLAKIGGSITVTMLEASAKRERRNSLDYDLNLGYYSTDVIDPDEITSFIVQSGGGAMAGYTQYKNEQVDAWVKAAQVELDPDKRLQIYKDIQKQVTEDAHLLYLYYPTGDTVTQSYVRNFRILPTGSYRLWETWRDDV